MDQDNNQQFLDQQNQPQTHQQQVQHVSLSTQQLSRDQTKLQQDHVTIYRQDVRIKRHPELQPFVPSDRFTTFSTSSSTTTVNNVLTSKSPSTNPLTRQAPYTTNKNGKSSKSQASSLSSGQPKKFVSMTRLNQLAQPKKRQSPPKSNQSLTRTNNSSQEDSVNRTINKSQERRSSVKDSQREAKPLNKGQEDAVNRVTNRSHRDSGSRSVVDKSRRESGKRALNKSREELANRTIDKGQEKSEKTAINERNQELSGNRTVDRGQEATGTRTLGKIDSIQPTDNHILDKSQEVIGNLTLDKGQEESRDDPTIDKNSEEIGSDGDWSVNKVQKNSSNSISQISTTNASDIKKKSPHEMSLAEQISEVSINDPFYESAASELVPESENSDNGINFDGPLNQSLLRELEQDLHVMSHNQSQIRHTDSLGDDISQDSATTVAETPSPEKKIVPTLEEEQEEDDRRIKIEKELREKARLEEEERKQRDQIVENILSRFSQGSVS